MNNRNQSGSFIRACRPADVGAVLELWHQAGATPSITDTADDLRRTVDGGHVLVAEVEGQIVGSIIGTFDGWRGNIYRLAVLPAYRRRGVARALVAEVEKRLTSICVAWINLLASGVPIVEHLRGLDQLAGSRFRFFAVPVKVKGMGTYPVRAFALVEAAS